VRGLATALSLLTVLPVRVATVERGTAAAALRWAPVVGLLLGAAAGGLVVGLSALGLPPLVVGLLTVGALALATRGMHLDGLADTADGLGCYDPPERALAVLRDGGAGPFAVVTLVVVLGVQAASLGALGATPVSGGAVPAAALAAAAGRAAFAWSCRRGVPPARPDGLGALVAGSQPAWVAPLWWLGLAAASVPVLGWRGPVGIALAAAVAVGLARHTARRFGGVTGDALGAASELATTAVLVVVVVLVAPGLS
jgi:adenosylcobinamide-GDP ribazoletransferase